MRMGFDSTQLDVTTQTYVEWKDNNVLHFPIALTILKITLVMEIGT